MPARLERGAAIVSATIIENEAREIAEAVRAACVRAALEGYEQAGMDGLCHEGAWEAAVDAIRGLDLNAIIRDKA